MKRSEVKPVSLVAAFGPWWVIFISGIVYQAVRSLDHSPVVMGLTLGSAIVLVIAAWCFCETRTRTEV